MKAFLEPMSVWKIIIKSQRLKMILLLFSIEAYKILKLRKNVGAFNLDIIRGMGIF